MDNPCKSCFDNGDNGNWSYVASSGGCRPCDRSGGYMHYQSCQENQNNVEDTGVSCYGSCGACTPDLYDKYKQKAESYMAPPSQRPVSYVTLPNTWSPQRKYTL